MSDDERLVRSWIGGAEVRRLAIDVDRFARYVPELGWRTILAILEDPIGRLAAPRLAVPLGYIAAKFGPAFIDRIELEAATNPPFRVALRPP